MSAHVTRLTRLFTPEYARRINAQIVHPAQSVVVKPNELESALMRPLQVACYEPERSVGYLASTLAYGVMQGHPFQDGNKRTAFFLANAYMRANGHRGLGDKGQEGDGYRDIEEIVRRHIGVAAGRLGVEELAGE